MVHRIVSASSLVILFVLVLLLPVIAHALECYHCLSSSSIGDCNKSKKTRTCPDVANRCASIYTEIKSDTGSMKSYYWGCATETMCKDAQEKLSVCNQLQLNHTNYETKCNVTCCTGNVCSAVSESVAIAISTHLFLSCLFTILGIFWKIS